MAPFPDLSNLLFNRNDDHSSKPNIARKNGSFTPQPKSASQGRPAKHPRLSRPVPLMRPEYDVVVIGSGYGGGVAASRMARAGKTVAVLEMGKEKWPGEYPSTLAETLPELHVSGNAAGVAMGAVGSIASGKRTGLYHVVTGEGQNAFIGKGLGGTSLINANVFLECDKRTLALGAWPPELRKDADALRSYYALAAEMLQPTPYPDDYPPLKKLAVLEKQAEALGQKHNFYRVPQTTFFRDGLNGVGVEMKASTGSGQDCTGVNDGSKNSVLMNYIADAWNWGAEIFCECEVRHIKRDPGGEGYIVFYAWHGNGRERFEDAFYNDLMWVHAKELCFLGAGALGTTEILLRSRSRGLEMSSLVGQKLSGNGDMLSFGYNSDETVNGIGRANGAAESPTGPTITGVIDNRDARSSPNVLDSYIIEEGAIPQALAPLLQSMLGVLPGRQGSQKTSAQDQLRRLLSHTQTRFSGPYSQGGSINKTQTYLVMSHDSNEGILTLSNEKPCLQLPRVGRTGHYEGLNAVLAKATDAIGGTLISSSFRTPFNQQKGITVHPLGGAIMSSDGTGRSGATNHLGQVFSGHGSNVYEGLFCVDGAVIPTALGVNPFATITALAERSVHLIALSKGMHIDTETKNGRLNPFGTPARSISLTPPMVQAQNTINLSETSGGVRFTEIMQGHIYIGDGIDDFTIAEKVAKGASSSASLYLSVDAYSYRDTSQSDHQSSIATGTFSCGAISKDPLLVHRGQVNFFSVDETVSDATQICYQLILLSTDGQTYHLNGHKALGTKMAFSISSTWKATTTLLTTLTRPDGSLAGKGKLHISLRNFTSELQTLSPLSAASDLLTRASTLSTFVGHFAQKTVGDYSFAPFRKLQVPQPPQPSPPQFSDILPNKNVNNTRNNSNKNNTPVPHHTITHLTASDGVHTTLHTYATNSPSPLPILMIPGASVSHAIFALPAVRTNAITYLTRTHHHTVHVLVPRFGRTPAAALGGTVYDARLDVLAALEHIRGEEAAEKGKQVYVIAHCLGAAALSMALLDGTVPAAWMRGIACTQIFFALRFGRQNALKAASPVGLTGAYAGVVRREWFPIGEEEEEGGGRMQGVIDQALRVWPVGEGEGCGSGVCRRFTLAYGRCWEHGNLNRETHERLGEWVGGAHMRMLEQVVKMGRVGRVVDNEGRDGVVTEEGLERLRGVPILFVSGGENVVFDPESTAVAYDVMRRKFGPEMYRRRVIQGYGHLDTWMGKDAAKDVFPVIGEHLAWCEREGWKESGDYRDDF